DLRPSLPEQAELLILKAVSFDPKDRYASAREFGDDLSYALLNKETAEFHDQKVPGPAHPVVALNQPDISRTTESQETITAQAQPGWSGASDPAAGLRQPS